MKFVDGKVRCQESPGATGSRNIWFPEMGLRPRRPGYPPPPGFAGISSLAGISELILETQSLRGKILVSKNLAPPMEEWSSETGPFALRLLLRLR
jgi:hypothetical protein